MKISELVAALTAELIRGNDADIGFTVPLQLTYQYLPNVDAFVWTINGEAHHTYIKESLQAAWRPEEAEFRHREGGVMEIVLT